MSNAKKFNKETKLQAKVTGELKRRYGGWVWAYHPRESAGGRKGVLDLILCFYGLFVVIELKRNLDDDGPNPLQAHNIRLIRRAGGYGFAADTIEDVLSGLEKIRKDKILKGVEHGTGDHYGPGFIAHHSNRRGVSGPD